MKHSINIFCYNYEFNCLESPSDTMILQSGEEGGIAGVILKVGSFSGVEARQIHSNVTWH